MLFSPVALVLAPPWFVADNAAKDDGHLLASLFRLETLVDSLRRVWLAVQHSAIPSHYSRFALLSESKYPVIQHSRCARTKFPTVGGTTEI